MRIVNLTRFYSNTQRTSVSGKNNGAQALSTPVQLE